MRSDKKAVRIVVRESEETFRTKTIETAKRLNMRKDLNIREPSISKKNNGIIFIRKEIKAKRNAIFDKLNRISMRIMLSFETTKPKRNTVVYQYGERKEE